MQKLLIITRHTPLPWEDGAGAYLHDMARFLAGNGFRVEVLWLAPHEHLRWQKIWRLPALFSPKVRLYLPDGYRFGRNFVFPNIVWLPFKAKLFGVIRRMLGRIGIRPAHSEKTGAKSAGLESGHTWSSPPTPGELARVNRFAENSRPDVVIASYAWMCPVLDLPAFRATRRACLAHDIGWKRAALSAHLPASAASRQTEADWLRHAGLIIAISESDAGELRMLAPNTPVMVAPKALETHTPFAESDSRRLLFVGSDNPFNAEGLEWFLNEVWPVVLGQIPGTILDVCGSIDRTVSLRPEGVVFHGPVTALDGYYQHAAIVIVPLLRATGLNIKLVEAASFGRAIVTTPVTMNGAPFLRAAAVIAETPEEFATAIRWLLKDRAARATIATRGLSAVRTHLAPKSCYGPLSALLTRHD